jgi:hypothetical protein
MIDITIGIVTFKERESLVIEMLSNLKTLNNINNVDIILTVNGNNEEKMPDTYRQSMINLSKNHTNVYPIICPEFKSLAKLWNTIVIFSKTNYNIILTDDVFVGNVYSIDMIDDFIGSTGCEFFTINNQFSHFVVTKKILHTLGYFDERFIAFGEEDGDMVHRYIEMFNNPIENLHIPNFYNMARYDLTSNELETHIDNKPRFNREFSMLKYKENTDGIYGMSPVPIIKIMDDYQQYPYEEFVIENKHNIKKFKKVVF